MAAGYNQKGPFDPMKRETTTHYQTDEAKILALFEDLLEDWGRGDGEAYGSHFTEDADYVAFDGTRTRGRREISASHQLLFDRFFKGTHLTGNILSIKFPSPDVALIHATGAWQDEAFAGTEFDPNPRRRAQGHRMALAAFHNSRIRPIGSNAATFLLWAVTDRLWRIFAPGKKGS